MIATAEQYAAMLDAASAGGYALPAVNVTSSETLNGTMRGFAEAGLTDPVRYAPPEPPN